MQLTEFIMSIKNVYLEFSRLGEYLQSLSLLFARLLVAYGFYEPAMTKWSDMKCGAGKCGSSMKAPAKKCGASMKKEGKKCGAAMKKEGKKCGASMKKEMKKPMKCGKGKCGSN